MDFPFKITQEAGTFQFLHIKPGSEHRTPQNSNLQLQVYLSLAQRLALGFDCYALLPYSPDIPTLWPDCLPVNYRYQLLADDFNGLGIDKGFERLSDGAPYMLMVQLKIVLTLRSLLEDSLGDKASVVSLFLLNRGRKEALINLLRSNVKPAMIRFLEKNELFIHLTCGKEQGYYDGMLIRSLTDISVQISGAIQLSKTAEYL